MAQRVLLCVLAVAVAALGAVAVEAATPGQVTSAHRQAAIVAADAMLAGVALPAGSTELTPAPNIRHLLSNGLGRLFFAAQVDRHGYWTTTASPEAVLASVRAGLPSGSSAGQSGSSGVGDAYASYELPAIDPSALEIRQIAVSVLTLQSGGTAVRVDAEVQYIAPRPADEAVPRQSRLVEITRSAGSSAPSFEMIVVNRAEVRRIAAFVDALPFGGNWAGVAFSCPAYATNYPVIRFIFRATQGGPALAELAEYPDTPVYAEPCVPATLVIRGHSEPGLMDGGQLLREVDSMLGLRLTRG